MATACVLVVGIVAETASAERLPMRRYTSADGLAGDYIASINRDSRGFLWFSTRDGLSRFDGTRFVTYGIADGLPTATVNGVFQTRDGVYWVATNGGGVCRFNPRGRRPAPGAVASSSDGQSDDQLFTAFSLSDEPNTNRVNVLLEDRAGRLWAGSDGGLFRREPGDRGEFRRVLLPLVPADSSFHGVHAIVEGADGSVWVGGGWGLSRLLPDGRRVAYRIQPAGARDIADSLLFASESQLWVGFRRGLALLDIEAASSFADETDPIVRTLIGAKGAGAREGGTAAITGVQWYTTADGLPSDGVSRLIRTADGRLWAGTPAGLGEFDGQRFRSYSTANGLTDNRVTAFETDSAGNLWIGTVAGVTRLIRHGLVTYDVSDGLGRMRIHSLSQNDLGHVFVVGEDFVVTGFDGREFRSVRPGVPRDAGCLWLSPCGYLDRGGGWWLLTSAGLYRSPNTSRLSALARPLRREITSGLPGDIVFNIFEDRRSDLWMGLARGGIVRWQRSTGTWREYSASDGLPQPRGSTNMASAFAEDAAGELWVGFYDGGVARLRNGRFELLGPSDGVPAGLISVIYRDHSGRLWIGSNQSGLARIETADGDRPAFVPVGATRGLNVRCITEDATGRIYAGTSRGIYRVDSVSGGVRHFGVGEGLASEFVTAALSDRRGRLWFGTISGLSTLDPSIDSPSESIEAAPVLISALRVRGVPHRLSELGEAETAALTLSPDQNQLEIEFLSQAFHSGESVRYQYQVAGLDTGWTVPSDVQSVNYGGLPAGSYRFLVRSVRPDGAVGRPGVVRFTILPPVYARWWFILLSGLLAGGIAFLLYRARVAQLLRVERVRARIATDLHDDIGASLSQMAIRAEVARQRTTGVPGDLGEALEGIAETSRSLVDSMSDIVWAVNPEADSLSDLVHRMRRFAEDTLDAIDVELVFRAPDTRNGDWKIGADIRREVFLILKESVTNVAKHAACNRVTIDLACDRHRLRLEVSDNGRGFDPDDKTDGNGVASMRRRVAALGGQLVIDAAPGRGTTLVVELDQTTGLRRLLQ